MKKINNPYILSCKDLSSSMHVICHVVLAEWTLELIYITINLENKQNGKSSMTNIVLAGILSFILWL